MSKLNKREANAFEVQAQFQTALALHQQGRLADAEIIYAEILQKAPDHFGALNLLGVIACQKRDYERAVQLISKAISINPNVAAAHSNLGVALKEFKRLEDALASYDKAIALKPDYAEAHHNRGLALKELGRPGEAIASYDKTIALKPDCEAFYHRGNALKELKRFEEAIASYDAAIALNPNYADAHSNRGNAFKELQRPGEALVSFERAIALNQNYAEAHYNRGNALKELGRIGEALASYDRAIALKPDFAEAHSNRGLVLNELGHSEEALASCNNAIALRPDLAEAYANRSVVLFELCRFKESLASCDKAVALKPDMANARNNLGCALNALGRLDEARAAFLKAIDIDPMSTGAYFSLAESKRFVPGDPHLAAMEKFAVSPERLSQADRIKLDFALGKAYADLKDHRRSFEHLRAGNAGKRATISYDEEAELRQFNAIETTFTRELIAAKAGSGDPSSRPIFVLGMPRSGKTTLVEQILVKHPMVHGAGELETFGKAAGAMYLTDGARIPYPGFVAALAPSALTDIATRYLAGVTERAPEGERVADEMPSNFFFIGLIHLALPKAKIIHTIRDPLDTCVACFAKHFAHGQHFTYDLGELGRYYKRYEHLMAHWRHVLPAGRILDVQFEEVVADLETQARRILAYCELPWDDRCLSFHETDRPVKTASVTQVRQPIYKSAVGRWRDYEEFLGPLLEALGVAPANADR